MISIEELSLRNNALTSEMIKMFEFPTELRVLDLSENEDIESMNGVDWPSKIEALNLEKTGVTSLSLESFKKGLPKDLNLNLNRVSSLKNLIIPEGIEVLFKRLSSWNSRNNERCVCK